MFNFENIDLNKLQDYCAMLNISIDKAMKRMNKIFKLDNETEVGIVISLDPLQVAFEQQNFDSAGIVEFPKELVEKYNIQLGDKLNVLNFYYKKRKQGKNLFFGLKYRSTVNNIKTLVMKFFLKEECLNEFNLNFSNYAYNILNEKVKLFIAFEGKPRDGLEIMKG